MGAEPLLGDVTDLRAVVDAGPAAGIFVEQDQEDSRTGIEDVVVGVDVTDMLTVGVIDARLLGRDSP